MDNSAMELIEQSIVAYAGRNYANPKIVIVDSINFDDLETIDDLINALVAFKEKNSGLMIECNHHDSEYSYSLEGFVAKRQETPEEVAKRIDGYRNRINATKEARRSQYELMKREFGDA